MGGRSLKVIPPFLKNEGNADELQHDGFARDVYFKK